MATFARKRGATRARVRTIYRNVISRVNRRRSYKPRKKNNMYLTVGLMSFLAVVGYMYKDKIKQILNK